MNPLFNGAQNAQMSGINPQAIQNIMGMIQRGADIKDVVVAFKKNGITPQVAEMALCMAFPQLKDIKAQMAGMSQQDIFSAFAKKANIAPSEVEKSYSSLMRLVN